MAGILRLSKLLVLVVALTACTTMKPHVDHVMLGISDLDRGIRELESLTGVRAVLGGEHPGRGTHNALVSLGTDTYIEVIAPRAGATVSADLADLAKLEHLTPVGWAVGASREQVERGGIKTTVPRAGSRKQPSGNVLHWETFELAERLDNALFFIQWRDPAKHPAKTSPGGCSLGGIEFDDPKADELTRVIRALGLDFPVASGTPAMRVTLRCGERTVRLPAN